MGALGQEPLGLGWSAPQPMPGEHREQALGLTERPEEVPPKQPQSALLPLER